MPSLAPLGGGSSPANRSAGGLGTLAPIGLSAGGAGGGSAGRTPSLGPVTATRDIAPVRSAPAPGPAVPSPSSGRDRADSFGGPGPDTDVAGGFGERDRGDPADAEVQTISSSGHASSTGSLTRSAGSTRLASVSTAAADGKRADERDDSPPAAALSGASKKGNGGSKGTPGGGGSGSGGTIGLPPSSAAAAAARSSGVASSGAGWGAGDTGDAASVFATTTASSDSAALTASLKVRPVWTRDGEARITAAPPPLPPHPHCAALQAHNSTVASLVSSLEGQVAGLAAAHEAQLQLLRQAHDAAMAAARARCAEEAAALQQRHQVTRGQGLRGGGGGVCCFGV
jgi:hypothetical protein